MKDWGKAAVQIALIEAGVIFLLTGHQSAAICMFVLLVMGS